MIPQKLRLEEFRAIYRETRGWPPPIRFLLLGFLYWLETQYIDAKAKAEVEKAVAKYNNLIPPYQPIEPILIEKPSQVEGLPEMRITAPWYERSTTRTED